MEKLLAEQLHDEIIERQKRDNEFYDKLIEEIKSEAAQDSFSYTKELPPDIMNSEISRLLESDGFTCKASQWHGTIKLFISW